MEYYDRCVYYYTYIGPVFGHKALDWLILGMHLCVGLIEFAAFCFSAEPTLNL